MFRDGVNVQRFQPSQANERAALLVAATRQALDALDAAVARGGPVPSWVESRLQRGLTELRMAAAYAVVKPREKAFRPSGEPQ